MFLCFRFVGLLVTDPHTQSNINSFHGNKYRLYSECDAESIVGLFLVVNLFQVTCMIVEL